MASNSSFSKTSQEAEQRANDLDLAASDPSLGETSSHMKDALSGFIAARVELASIEAKEAAQFAAKKAIHGIIMGISVFFVWILIMAGLTGIFAPMFDVWFAGKISWLPGWSAVLFALAILHLIIAIIAVICLKKKPSLPLFELTRQEIENDKQWLQKNK